MKKKRTRPDLSAFHPYLNRSGWEKYSWWETDLYTEAFKNHMRAMRESILSRPNGHIFNAV
jgi:hypothetical protein